MFFGFFIVREVLTVFSETFTETQETVEKINTSERNAKQGLNFMKLTDLGSSKVRINNFLKVKLPLSASQNLLFYSVPPQFPDELAFFFRNDKWNFTSF